MKKRTALFPVLFFLLSFASDAAKADRGGWRDGGVGHNIGCFIIKAFGYEACEG
ncbi:hypothetical protein [Serratia marcescens]|uniref:hypothetical protein n=1 Tax=Serratia marcescens TaxID=615 RepID=UPI003FA7566F|nr:hypothetical protein [Serratia marcescens]